jgi:hypothetical protein
MATAHDTIVLMRSLRRRGRSIPEISTQTGTSRTTVLRHVGAIKIAPQYRARWLARRNASKMMSERAWHSANEKAERTVGVLSSRDFMLFAAALYWAEGAKKDLTFTNTDAPMIRLFIRVLRRTFDVSAQDIKISLRIYEDLERKKCLSFWSKTTGCRLSDTTTVSVLHGKKRGKLPYGMCRIRVRKGGRLLKEIFSIINKVAIQYPPRSSTDRTAHS